MILAGDIGATHTRLAGFNPDGNKLVSVVERVYETQKHQSLAQIISEFVRTEGVPVNQACIGVAGPVRGGKSKPSNFPWVIDARELAAQLRLSAVGLINDLEAYAYGIEALQSADFITLSEGAKSPEGNMAVISATTGLGEAGLYWDGFRHHPFACEGGHADFAPRNEVEIDLLKYLLTQYEHVSCERILSGPGIKNIYDFLHQSRRAEEPAWLKDQISQSPDPPALISQLALEKKAPICEQSLDIFISAYGAETGNCALKFMSTAGIFIGGSIAAKIVPKMKEPTFMKAFLAKGRMQPLLEDFPVKIVLNDSAGLIGAARCALIQKAFGRTRPAEAT
ncbi:MAG TPA: glucokinase [Terriglobia bacterium]|nr:glucokinase [Terriglobia bacterium]